MASIFTPSGTAAAGDRNGSQNAVAQQFLQFFNQLAPGIKSQLSTFAAGQPTATAAYQTALQNQIKQAPDMLADFNNAYALASPGGQAARNQFAQNQINSEAAIAGNQAQNSAAAGGLGSGFQAGASQEANNQGVQNFSKYMTQANSPQQLSQWNQLQLAADQGKQQVLGGITGLENQAAQPFIPGLGLESGFAQGVYGQPQAQIGQNFLGQALGGALGQIAGGGFGNMFRMGSAAQGYGGGIQGGITGNNMGGLTGSNGVLNLGGYQNPSFGGFNFSGSNG